MDSCRNRHAIVEGTERWESRFVCIRGGGTGLETSQVTENTIPVLRHSLSGGWRGNQHDGSNDSRRTQVLWCHERQAEAFKLRHFSNVNFPWLSSCSPRSTRSFKFCMLWWNIVKPGSWSCKYVLEYGLTKKSYLNECCHLVVTNKQAIWLCCNLYHPFRMRHNRPQRGWVFILCPAMQQVTARSPRRRYGKWQLEVLFVGKLTLGGRLHWLKESIHRSGRPSPSCPSGATYFTGSSCRDRYPLLLHYYTHSLSFVPASSILPQTFYSFTPYGTHHIHSKSFSSISVLNRLAMHIIFVSSFSNFNQVKSSPLIFSSPTQPTTGDGVPP